MSPNFDASSFAVATAFAHVGAAPQDVLKLRLVMDGVQIAEGSFIFGFGSTNRTQVLIGTKALSGVKTCLAQLHNYDGGSTQIQLCGGSSAQYGGFAISVGSIKK